MGFFQKNLGRISLMAATLACLLSLGAGGGAWPLWVAYTGVLLLLGLALMVMFAAHENKKQDSEKLEQTQTQLKRLEALIATQNRATLVMDFQGQVLETRDVPSILGPGKFLHIDNLVNAIDDGAELMTAYKRMKQTGQGFVIRTYALVDRRLIAIRGQRHVGPTTQDSFDVLWIRDNTQIQNEMDEYESKINLAEQQAQQAFGLMDILPCPLWIVGDDLSIQWCNSAYAQAVGQARETVMKNQTDLFPVTSKGAMRNLLGKALLAERAQTEKFYAIVDGKRKQFDVVVAAYAGDDGSKKSMLCFAQDISEVERHREEVKRHVDAHNEVLENLAAPIAIYGPDQRMIFYNRAYVQLWDFDEAFLSTGPSFSEIIENLRARRRAPEQADFQRYKRERLALFTSLIEPREDMMHLPDGTTLRIMAIPHPFGGVMFVHEDVTDRLALEASYNTVLAVQRETLDHLSEGVAVLGSDGRLKLYNPSFVAAWNLNEQDLSSEPHISELLELMRPMLQFENWTQYKSELIGQVLDRNSRKAMIRRADQGIINLSTVPLPDGAVLNCFLDVSDSIKVEQALRASNAALAAADRLKSEFVANVSYQLRTPLNTIMGFAEILANQYFGTLNERQLDYARTLLESSKKLKTLIDDVLDVAMIEAGRMTLDKKQVSVSGLVQSVVQMLSERIRQQGLQLKVDLSSHLGQFHVDEKRIKQAIFNLLSNAIQYTPPGGIVSLHATRNNQQIVITVSDTGVGIPPADQARVWGKFERANPQIQQNGVGLGLALVRAFIELHGGTIHLQSAVHQGTTVTCHIPV